VSKPTDLELMLHADGEGDLSSDDLAKSPSAQAKVEGIREVGSLVRTHLELSADAAEDRLAGLWDLVERRLDVEERAAAPVVPKSVPAPVGAWARLVGWFGRQRAPIVTGLVTAGAAAALMFALRPAPKVVTRTVYAPTPGPIDVNRPVGAQDPVTPTLVRASPAQVEALDVSGGTGSVFTIDDDDGETTVIWVTPDDVEEL
jgi:hypothetical protein